MSKKSGLWKLATWHRTIKHRFNCNWWKKFLWFILGGVKFEFLGSSDTLTTDLNKLQPFVKGTTGPLAAVYLDLHNQPVPIMNLLRCQLTDRYPDHGGYSWPMLLGRLTQGELIYPWVKSRNFRYQLKKQFSAAQLWLYQWEYKFSERSRDVYCM